MEVTQVHNWFPNLSLFTSVRPVYLFTELAWFTRVAEEELKATGTLVRLPRLASKRKARWSMAASAWPRSRRKSAIKGDEDSQTWLAAREEKEVVINFNRLFVS